MKSSFAQRFWLCMALAFCVAGCYGTTTTSSTTLPTDENSEETTAEDTSSESLFTVDAYDPDRDAAADLKMTVATAKPANKKILLEIGGKW